MQFKRKTSLGSLSKLGKLFIKLLLIIIIIFVAILFVEKIDFPAPNKKIEKQIPNENFKTIK